MNCPRRYTCWQSKKLYWERVPRGQAEGWGNPWGLLCHAAHSGLDFMVVGFISGLSLAHHSNSWSFLVVHALRRMDSNEKDSGRLVRHRDWCLLSPSDLSWILPIGGGLLVSCSLPAPPGKTTHADGNSGARVGSFSQWFPPTLPLTVFQWQAVKMDSLLREYIA